MAGGFVIDLKSMKNPDACLAMRIPTKPSGLLGVTLVIT